MARTYQHILDEARDILQDTTVEYRYTDTVLARCLNRGLLELSRIRPEAFGDLFDSSIDDITVWQVTDTPVEDNEVDIDDDLDISLIPFMPALVYFVAGSAELSDDEFTQDGRASTMLAQFRQQVASL